MKRWQDRGEVLDSDDEELSLGVESQSPERPRKKLKLGQGRDDRAKTGSGREHESENGDQDEDWMQPRVETTYGKKSRSSRRDIDVTNTEPEQPGHEVHSLISEPLTSPQYGRSEGHGSVNVDRKDSDSGHFQNLPDLRPIIATQGGGDDGSTEGEQNDLPIAASSPLSEREISPPPPIAGFRFPKLGTVNVSPTPSPPTDELEDLSVDHIITDELRPDPTVVGRRSLRTRNEKQLHPYMFDKAQYLRQCRQRGIRPVRYVEAEQRAVETQDAFMSGDESESQIINRSSSSPPRPLSRYGDGVLAESSGPAATNVTVGNTDPNSDDELPDLRNVFSRPRAAEAARGSARRGLAQISIEQKATKSRTLDVLQYEQQDEFSVPPSPPPTSSDSQSHQHIAPALGGFRMPRGLTPAPLPTPQISSDIRNGQASVGNDNSDADLPSSRSRQFIRSRSRTQTITLDSSPSNTESQAEIDARRLQRERKRIKGVLPASWLKIDFRAQQKQKSVSPSPLRERRQSSASPPTTIPQKGVARPITSTRSHSPSSANVILISDRESAPSSTNSSPSPPRMKQLRLEFEREHATAAPSEFADVDQMEVDWVDPMFADSIRKRPKSSTKKRQPRITDAFTTTAHRATDFTGDNHGLRDGVNTTASRVQSTKVSRSVQTRKRRTPTAHKLSIIDAAQHVTAPNETQPPFVRLAMRAARTRADGGRHSPSRKQIRLATEGDTEEATIVLRAWREGTIVPRESVTGAEVQDTTIMAGELQDRTEPTLRLRPPLAERSVNVQQLLPAPGRKEVKARTASKTVSTLRRPGVQQTRLQPGAISTRPQTAEVPRRTSATDEARTRKPHHRQTPAIRHRGAQLESLESEFDQHHRPAAFERRMQLLTETVARRQNRNGLTQFQLARFLDDLGEESPSGPADSAVASARKVDSSPQACETSRHKAVLPHRTRKRQTRRIDAEAREYRQPSEPLPQVINVDDFEVQSTSVVAPGLQGLGPFGTKYATDFDVLPLSVGTYFHESTFIGSGDFAASLDFAGRDLDTPTGRISVHVDGDILEWGAWTEDVATGLIRIPHAVSGALQSLHQNENLDEDNETVSLVLSNIDYLLRSTVRYFARCLAFLDPVDRHACVQRLQRFVEDIFETIDEHTSTGKLNDNVIARCLQYALVLSKQALKLCDHPLVQGDVKLQCRTLVTRSANRLASHYLPSRLNELRSFYEDNRHAAKRESGIRDLDLAVCSTVILRHVLDDSTVSQSPFWTVVYQALNVDFSDLSTALAFDTAWYSVFTILPTFEIELSGVARVGTRLRGMREDWSLVKKLVDRLFDLYTSSSSQQGSTINDYLRATLRRCCCLVNRWGWWRCELILGTVFDFFARRGLAQLHNEESRGSPGFLEQLGGQPSLEVQADDRSFHIFLKMLASGLKGMQKHEIYPDKKIGTIAWRFIPNHGRTYRKDAEVRREDLNALRNHHDLLSTLYYTSPSAHRLRVDLVQSLVDHSASHREACRLNVRAWANLASFQMSTHEGTDHLDAFILWYRDILTTTMNQYRLARVEVEQDVASAKANGNGLVSPDVVENTIARNQRHICATLVDALAAMKRAIASSSSLANARYLIEGSAFWQVFDLYDSTARWLSSMLQEALALVKTALEVQRRFEPRIESQNWSNDSQDYGDATALQVLASTEVIAAREDNGITDVLHSPISQLVSNVFGADEMADDQMLTMTVDVWTQLAQVMVRSGKTSWINYISGYTSDAWSQLRDTEPRRKFTPYFLSRLVGTGDIDLAETGVLAPWLNSLVERESMLKYQHTLTSTLLNRHPDDPLLRNLPFSHRATGAFDISLQELRQRRLSLLSSVLSNMRNHFDEVLYEDSRSLPGLRKAYADLLKQLMHAMKSYYQQLEISGNEQIANSQAQGAYVEFVQHVVSFMQQYTTDICQVDRFFTESSAFPLPATDPMYVVGRLKAYVPKLVEARKRKELVVFVQAVSERAAVDGQQTYLVNQLVAAMAGVLERGDAKAPSLRHALMTMIFPAYIEGALSTACSWIVAKPILHACGRTAEGLLYNTNWEDEHSIQAIKDILLAILHGMTTLIERALAHYGLILLPHVQTTLAAVFETTRQCLTVVHHLQRATQINLAFTDMVTQFTKYSVSIEARLSGSSDVELPEICPSEVELQCLWPETLDFTRKQLQDKLSSDWYAHNGQYYVRRGNHSVEVVVNLKDEDEEQLYLLETLKQFQNSHDTIFNGRSTALQHVHDSCGVSGLIV